jgi:hypothetical protein
MDSLDEQIAQIPHIVRIERDSWDIPKIDYAKYGGEGEFIRDGANSIIKVLGLPYVVDDFSSHTERNAWLFTLGGLYPREVCVQITETALRVNSLRELFGAVLLIDAACGYLGTHDVDGIVAAVKRVQALEDLRSYDKKTAEQKVEYVKSVKAAAYGILEALAQ